MNEKIFFSSCFAPQAILQKYQLQIRRILAGELHGLNFKKLHGPNKVYSARLNDEQRLLFSVQNLRGNNVLVFLEVYDSHKKYEQSRYLRSQGMVTQTAEKMITEAECFEDIDDAQFKLEIEKHGFNFSSNATTDPEWVNLSYDQQKFIQLNDSQKGVLYERPPFILLGSAGAGKTTIAQQSLRNYNPSNPGQADTVLYLATNEILVNRVEKSYCEGQPNPDVNVEFASWSSFLRPLVANGKKEANKEFYLSWIRQHLQHRQDYKSKYPELDRHYLKKEREDKIYHQFKLISGYKEAAYINGLGQNQDSKYDETFRTELVKLYKAYLGHLKTSNRFDPNFVNKDELTHIPTYDRVVVDEAQDFSLINLWLIYNEISKSNQCIILIDPDQSLDGRESHLHYLTTKLGVKIVELTKSLRCPQIVMALANKVLDLRKQIEPLRKNKKETLPGVSALDKKGQVNWVGSKSHGEKLNYLNQLICSPMLAIITSENNLAEAKRKFGTKLVFTAKQIKGLEYPHILIYKPFTDRGFKIINDALDEKGKTTDKGKKIGSENACEQAINWLYVACTRASDTLWFFQDQEHSHKYLYQYLYQGLQEINQLLSNSDNAEQPPGLFREPTRQDWENESDRLAEHGNYEQAKEVFLQHVGTEKQWLTHCSSKGIKPQADSNLTAAENEPTASKKRKKKKKNKNNQQSIQTVPSCSSSSSSLQSCISQEIMTRPLQGAVSHRSGNREKGLQVNSSRGPRSSKQKRPCGTMTALVTNLLENFNSETMKTLLEADGQISWQCLFNYPLADNFYLIDAILYQERDANILLSQLLKMKSAEVIEDWFLNKPMANGSTPFIRIITYPYRFNYFLVALNQSLLGSGIEQNIFFTNKVLLSKPIANGHEISFLSLMTESVFDSLKRTVLTENQKEITKHLLLNFFEKNENLTIQTILKTITVSALIHLLQNNQGLMLLNKKLALNKEKNFLGNDELAKLVFAFSYLDFDQKHKIQPFKKALLEEQHTEGYWDVIFQSWLPKGVELDLKQLALHVPEKLPWLLMLPSKNGLQIHRIIKNSGDLAFNEAYEILSNFPIYNNQGANPAHQAFADRYGFPFYHAICLGCEHSNNQYPPLYLKWLIETPVLIDNISVNYYVIGQVGEINPFQQYDFAITSHQKKGEKKVTNQCFFTFLLRNKPESIVYINGDLLSLGKNIDYLTKVPTEQSKLLTMPMIQLTLTKASTMLLKRMINQNIDYLKVLPADCLYVISLEPGRCLGMSVFSELCKSITGRSILIILYQHHPDLVSSLTEKELNRAMKEKYSPFHYLIGDYLADDHGDMMTLEDVKICHWIIHTIMVGNKPLQSVIAKLIKEQPQYLPQLAKTERGRDVVIMIIVSRYLDEDDGSVPTDNTETFHKVILDLLANNEEMKSMIQQLNQDHPLCLQQFKKTVSGTEIIKLLETTKEVSQAAGNQNGFFSAFLFGSNSKKEDNNIPPTTIK